VAAPRAPFLARGAHQTTHGTYELGSEAKVNYGGGQFSKDGKGIYVTTEKDPEFHRLAYIDLASKQHTYLTTKIPWDIDEFDLSDNGKLLAFIANEDAFGVLHVLDTATRSEKTLSSLPRASSPA
jgi:hypothetical protein